MNETLETREGIDEDVETVEDKVRAELLWEAYHEFLNQQETENYGYFCPRCGTCHGQWRGYRHLKNKAVKHRRRCNACGRWFAIPC